MGAFGGLILTNKGRNLQAKAQTGVQLNFTKIKIGDGSLSGQSIVDLTDLISTKKELTILGLQTLAGGKAKLRSYFSNTDITTGFYWRELGVFAQDPQEGEILYCYGNAGANAEYIPAGGGPDVVERYINVITLTGNASNISATLGSEIYVTQADFESHASRHASGGADPLAPADIGAETPNGAQAKVDAHGGAIQTHGASGSYYLAKTSRTDQLPAWADIPDKPSSFTPSAHKNTHATGGADALAPGDIGAAAQADFAAHLAEIVTTPQPNKILRLDGNGKLPASITGDANSVGGKTIDQILLTGRDYYVNQTTGSDTNNGDSSAPLKTLQEAINRTPIGGTCRIVLQSNYTMDSLLNILFKRVIIDGLSSYTLYIPIGTINDSSNNNVGTGILYPINLGHFALLIIRNITLTVNADLISSGLGNQWYWNNARAFIKCAGATLSEAGLFSVTLSIVTVNPTSNFVIVGSQGGVNPYYNGGAVYFGEYSVTYTSTPTGFSKVKGVPVINTTVS
ncbi:hypothetical protein [Moorella sp. E306M]|uniref:hypothetical protein n=1 Tax=Moorella sp. E306M TaxID=2572683 RepID=UPI0010FFBE92|nr:hypothetical protein [Moorella sp. E306M]GEA17730.1 hypothetical protein E306M_08640 [Moorella sp. E306M]GEA17799.1 hypothetical protein E306M_09330 [Moorella sp. E306M]